MKPLALALAATILGSGCIVVDDNGPAPCGASNLTLEWDFQLSTGAVAGCATAGVQWVDVWVGSDFADSFACADGGGTVYASAGSVVTVEGIDAAGRIAYRDWVTAPGGCGTRYASVRPAEGTANLNYGAEAPGCTSSPCYLWFSVYDETAATWAAVIDLGSPASVKDDYPYPEDVVIRLAAGSYTLDWMELVSNAFAGEQMTCAASAFDVAAAQATVVPATLTAACVP
jgi:hypothetical protein